MHLSVFIHMCIHTRRDSQIILYGCIFSASYGGDMKWLHIKTNKQTNKEETNHIVIMLFCNDILPWHLSTQPSVTSVLSL